MLIFAKNNLDPYIDLLKGLLPEILITHFDIIKHQTINDSLHLYFEEKKGIPEEFSKDMVISHGFYKEIIVEDFPLRGKTVLLHIKRRRWLNKTTQKVIYRDWNLVAHGTRMTIEFAAFLKAINQY
ncbi:transposase [Tenacibaculum tangerinum]|uniref:Transposase n=1 Tax=Tenacibaculum tangerinum TaxID=3038772 RepID=A0ABY8L3L3_9FLAO|nr:transposase [Tenacibaculum tangerinum]WGH74480.1 transposase [Tenacibaculum tangerinum]